MQLASAEEIVMSDVIENSGPLRHFRIGRRTVLQSLATGVGAAVFATRAPAEHAHHVAAAAASAADPGITTAAASPLFLNPHEFDTLALLSEQIVPGSRAAAVPEFLDRLLAVESTETQKRFIQAHGRFERAAREAHGKPWKALTAEQATALLTTISALPASDSMRQAFDGLKSAIAETYFSTEVGMKELGWNGGIAFAPPGVCG
jgi:hypothetical protein